MHALMTSLRTIALNLYCNTNERYGKSTYCNINKVGTQSYILHPRTLPSFVSEPSPSIGNSSGMGNPPGFGSPGFPGRVTGQSLTTRGVPVPIPVPVPILVDVDMLRAAHYVVCIALLYP